MMIIINIIILFNPFYKVIFHKFEGLVFNFEKNISLRKI